MRHQEIISQFKLIVQIYKDFKAFESTIAGHQERKEKLLFEHYLQEILRFNRRHQGTLISSILAVVTALPEAKPDFHGNGLSIDHMERFSQLTKGKSERMETQLELAKIMEVKALFKTESDIFNPQYITRIENILKEIK